MATAGVGVTNASVLAQRPEDLHDENRLAVVLESGTELAGERLHHFFVPAEHLRAHVVGDDLETTIGIETIDEAADGWNEVVPQWIEADLDADVHWISVTGTHTSR